MVNDMHITIEQPKSITIDLKNRYQRIRDGDFPDIDSNIIPLLEQLNEFDNVVTNWSCGGHESDSNFPHVVCAVGDMGYAILEYFIVSLINDPTIRLMKLQDLIEPKLMTLILPIDLTHTDNKILWYLAIVITFKSLDPKEVSIFINTSIEILKKMHTQRLAHDKANS